MNIKKIYFDYASTTPVCVEVKKEMQKCEGFFANPSSLYGSGVETKKILTNTRKKVAEILSAQERGIVFTSGGTEGNNIVILGLYKAIKAKNPKVKLHVIASTIEHSSVLETIQELEVCGVEVDLVRPDNTGQIDPREIKKLLRPETFLVSIAYANNEIGSIQPIREITKVLRKHNQCTFRKHTIHHSPLATYFHTDACQAANYLDLNVLRLGVDFMTLDGGKIYGPKGVGIVFRKHNAPLSPVMFGGGQEFGLRSGTENISAIVGFTKALEIAQKTKIYESLRLQKLQLYFVDKIQKLIPIVKINGGLINRLPNNISICIQGLEAEFAVFQLDREGIECSATSACLSLKDTGSSYVVEEVSGKECSQSSLRISLGRYTKKADVDYCLESLKKVLSS